MAKIQKANTTAGEFSRKTEVDYKFVVVWNSSRAKYAFAKVEAGEWSKTGKSGQWHKDRGYGVTWHGSESAARAAAAKGWVWDSEAVMIGIFPVEK